MRKLWIGALFLGLILARCIVASKGRSVATVEKKGGQGVAKRSRKSQQRRVVKPTVPNKIAGREQAPEIAKLSPLIPVSVPKQSTQKSDLKSKASNKKKATESTVRTKKSVAIRSAKTTPPTIQTLQKPRIAKKRAFVPVIHPLRKKQASVPTVSKKVVPCVCSCVDSAGTMSMVRGIAQGGQNCSTGCLKICKDNGLLTPDIGQEPAQQSAKEAKEIASRKR